MRGIVTWLVLMAGLLVAGPAWPHASLLRVDPPAGSVEARAPEKLTLSFNEPVSPLVFQIVGPDGARTPLTQTAGADSAIVVTLPPALARGTHVVSWRVVSADGHPVSGSFAFSVGAPSARDASAVETQTEWPARTAISFVRIVLYAGLFVGAGGAFYRAFVAEGQHLAATALRLVTAALIGGTLAAMLSVGLQGLDALARPLAELTKGEVWEAGLATSYRSTAQLATWAMIAALASTQAARPRFGKLLALVAAAFASAALAASGHAANAPPQWLMRGAVFFHAACLLFWIGALVPLAAILRRGDASLPELQRFSRAILPVVGLLFISGAVLSVVQVERVDALWTTAYGIVWLCKLVAVALLLAIAAWNRFRLTPRRADTAARLHLASLIRVELVIVAAIFALVALWRFTPPPRALAAAAQPVFVHLHTDEAMAELSLDPRRGPQDVTLRLLDGAFGPLAAKDVTLVLSNPEAGIEPMRWQAAVQPDGGWLMKGVRLPLSGTWHVRVEILVDDFKRIALEDAVELPDNQGRLTRPLP